MRLISDSLRQSGCGVSELTYVVLPAYFLGHLADVSRLGRRRGEGQVSALKIPGPGVG